MRILFEIFMMVAAVGAIFALGKGFPGFGAVLRGLLFNPIGILCIIGLVFGIVILRKNRARDRTRDHS